MLRRLLFSCLLLAAVSVEAKHLFLIEFKDRDTSITNRRDPASYLSQKSLERRKKFNIPLNAGDQPVSVVALRAIAVAGLKILTTSRWMNAAVVESDDKTTPTKIQSPFIRKITYLGQKSKMRTRSSVDINELLTALDAKVNPEKYDVLDSNIYGKMKHQIMQLNLHLMHAKGYNGRGISIAVLDAGFPGLKSNAYFSRLFRDGQILGGVDLVDPGSSVFEDDAHGIGVLSCLAAIAPQQALGTAFNASFWLIRTEDAETENLLEEFYWIAGAELADSVGADIIQSSVGYNEFDDAFQDHRYKDLNGKSTWIAKGAREAVARGIVVVCSSGNEGDNDWRKLVTPGDVEEVITVGGVDEEGHMAAFSSIGPTADKRIKPDLMALGVNTYVVSEQGFIYPGKGTSYACPLISGAVACLLHANKNRTPSEIANALRLSGDNYFDPDKFIGYGIPDIWLANAILQSRDSLCKLIDCRWIGKSLHITYCSRGEGEPDLLGNGRQSQTTPVKLQISVYDESGKLVYSDKWKSRQNGVFRFQIKKSSKWGKGTFIVRLNDGTHFTEYCTDRL